jgi:hypothetical protein
MNLATGERKGEEQRGRGKMFLGAHREAAEKG